MTHAERLAKFSLARAEVIMPDRPADRSRNGQRIPGSVKHKGMR
jgi:hypothetical protein